MSQANPRRESNPMLVQRFPMHNALQVTDLCIVGAIPQKMAFVNPRFVKKSKVLLVLGTLHKIAGGAHYSGLAPGNTVKKRRSGGESLTILRLI